MARKNSFISKLLTAQSLAGSFTSPVTVVRGHDNISYQIDITTSNSTGSFALQGSNDYQPPGPIDGQANPGTWTTLPLSGGTPTAGGSNDTILIDINQYPFNAVRLQYTPTVAGTGTASIWIMCRQIGG